MPFSMQLIIIMSPLDCINSSTQIKFLIFDKVFVKVVEFVIKNKILKTIYLYVDWSLMMFNIYFL